MSTRIISAAVGIFILIIILFFSNTIIFNLAMSLVSVVIIHELFRAEKCTQYKSAYAICIAYAAIMPVFSSDNFLVYRNLFAVFCVILLFLTYLALHKTLNFDKLSFMIATTALTSLSICCLISVKRLDEIHGVFYVILTLGAAWIADALAYFIGTFFGKHKLAPEISPKKTIEGAVGGIVFTGLVLDIAAFVYMKYQQANNIFFEVNYILIAFIGMACAVLGIIGDLSASLIKRQNQIKDYGNIMPGHGGMLDRFDSVLFVAPFMSIILAYVKIFY